MDTRHTLVVMVHVIIIYVDYYFLEEVGRRADSAHRSANSFFPEDPRTKNNVRFSVYISVHFSMHIIHCNCTFVCLFSTLCMHVGLYAETVFKSWSGVFNKDRVAAGVSIVS